VPIYAISKIIPRDQDNQPFKLLELQISVNKWKAVFFYRSTRCVKLTKRRITPGTPVGSIGFPLAFINSNTGVFHLIERFQGAYISSFHPVTTPTGRELYSYETDALMYKGSSGCPGFLVNGEVFGMHNASIINQPRVSERERQQEIRLAISLWVPAEDIIKFAKNNNIEI